MSIEYQFTGQRLQAELGIYWFQSRWMDPSLGRFTQPDSIVPTSTQGTQAWDRYAFVNNNPVRYTDPTGHSACNLEPEECEYLGNLNSGNSSGGSSGNASGNGGGGGGKPQYSPTATNPSSTPILEGCWENIDCALSFLGVVFTGAAFVLGLAAIAAPGVAIFATLATAFLIADIVVSLVAIFRTEVAYSRGEISAEQRLTLDVTSVLGMFPNIPGLGFSFVNLFATVAPPW